MTPRECKCEICWDRPSQGSAMCVPCGMSYDRRAHEDGSVLEAIIWAARHARFFAQRRSRTQGAPEAQNGDPEEKGT